jgi:hypothetical protein
LALSTFPLPYTFRQDVDEMNEYVNRTIVFESQKKQKQRVTINKLESWKILVEGTPAQRTTLKDFHDDMGGDATPFYFYTPDNTQVTARFVDGKLPIKDKREFNKDQPTKGTIVGFSCELTIEKVI